ncbi:N-acetylmuramoyl-L-alanine amidase [Rhodocaloribacter sp.]
MKFRLPLLFGLFLLLIAPARAQILHDLTDRTVALSAPQTTRTGKRAEISLTAPTVDEAFNGVVVQGFSSDPDFKGWIRFEADGAWGEWLPLHVVRSATGGDFVAGYRGDVFRERRRFELRFDVVAEASFSITGAGVFDNRKDDDYRAREGGGIVPLPGKKTGEIIPPPLITRAEWGAAPFIRGNPVPLANPDYKYMTFHHAAGFSATTKEEGIRQVKAIQDLHQNVRGWSDIGYQFAIDRGGRLYQGRPFLDGSTSLEEVPVLALGAHVGGFNTGNIGVVILGCYHPPEGSYCNEVITPEALDTYITLFAFLSERYGVPPELIRGHRDFKNTACPGDNNYPLLPGLRADVAKLILTGNQPLGEATLAAATDADGVVTLEWAFLADFGIVSYRIERTFEGVTTVVYEGEDAVPARFVDAGVSKPGVVLYELYARSATGREQLLTAVEVVVGVPERYTLADAFPNPFNGQTTIRYFLERDGVATLRVFDVTGREVQTLVDTFQKGGQWYAARFDASGLPGGVYFYRLRVEGFATTDFDKTGTLVLVK